MSQVSARGDICKKWSCRSDLLDECQSIGKLERQSLLYALRLLSSQNSSAACPAQICLSSHVSVVLPAAIHKPPCSSDRLSFCFLAGALHPTMQPGLLQRMVAFVQALHQAVNVKRIFGSSGAPWEFNLRDLLRWCQLIAASPCSTTEHR